MNDATNTNWKPSPELLAAFADGELDGRDDAAELRARVEAWLAKNPHAQAELDANQRLKGLFDRTRPASPTAETWREVMKRVEQAPTPAPVSRVAGRRLWMAVGTAAACLVGVALLIGSFRKPASAPEVFAVASDNDVEIVHIEGDALDSIVVGRLPLIGVLELADPGEVVVTNVVPARRDNMVPMVHLEGPMRPMIWAKLESEGQ